MKYKTVKIQRLFHGFASIRSYQVEEARKEKVGLKVVCEKEFILIPYKRLDEHFKNDEVFTSIHNPLQKYTLCDFDWKSFKPQTVEQLQFDIGQSVMSFTP